MLRQWAIGSRNTRETHRKQYDGANPLKICANGVCMKKSRKNDLFFGIMQKITTFACLFGEKP